MRLDAAIDIGRHQPTCKDVVSDNFAGGNLKLRALARMFDVAAHPKGSAVLSRCRRVTQARGAPQLRNTTTLGGNVLQSTPCTFFRDVSYASCNKRAKRSAGPRLAP
jgi:xanthine dehydrogenase YagS FAD-binding subunit